MEILKHQEIIQISSENDINMIDNFFGKMWKELFDIDCYNQHEGYKKCDIYAIKENHEIISAITIFINNDTKHIWRFGTQEKYRGTGLGTVLLKHVLDTYSGLICLIADKDAVPFYEKFGFQKNGNDKEIGNTMSYGMQIQK